MKKTTMEKTVDWILLTLIIGSVMLFGALRMHQLALNSFLLLSFGVIALLLVVYRVVYRRFFLPAEARETAAGEPDAKA